MPTETEALNVKFTGDSSGVVDAGRRASDAVDDFNKKTSKSSKSSAQFTRAQREAQRELKRLKGGLSQTTRALAGLASAYVGFQTLNKFKDVAVETARLNAVLKTATGSAEAAAEQFKRLNDFASRNVVQVDEAINAYVKMRNLGLNPTERALQSFTDTAVAQGKSLQQFIEAVADASTNEFERLKEFGIKASQEANNVTFTFQGVETKIEKSSEAIVEYLTNIGETKFAGASAEQMQTLVGQMSNLEQEVDNLFRAFGELGGNNALSAGLSASTEAVVRLKRELPALIEFADEIAQILGVLAAVVITRQLIPSLAKLSAGFTAATTTMTATQVVAKGLSGTMALMGGPAGVVVALTGVLILLADAFKGVKREASDLDGELEGLISKFNEAGTEAERFAALQKAQENLEQTRESLKNLRDELSNLQKLVELDNTLASGDIHLKQRNEENQARIVELKGEIAELERQVLLASGAVQGMNDTINEVPAIADSAAEGVSKLKDETVKLTAAQKDLIDEIKALETPQETLLRQLKAIHAIRGELSEEEYTRAIENIGKAMQKANPMIEAHNDLLDEAARLTEKLRTPQEEFAARIERLNTVYAEAGESFRTTYERAVIEAYDDMVKAAEKAAEESMGPWEEFGEEFKQTFRDSFIAAEGDLDDFLKRMEKSLKEAALRMVVDIGIDAIFGQGRGGNNGGGLNVANIAGAIFGQGFGVSGNTGGNNSGGGFQQAIGAYQALQQGNNIYSSLVGGTGTNPLSFLTGGNQLSDTFGAVINPIRNGFNSVGSAVSGWFGGGAGSVNPVASAGRTWTANATTGVWGAPAGSAGSGVAASGGGVAANGANPGLWGNITSAGVNAIGGIAGAYVGNVAGEAIFGKQAESNIGATAGAIIGSFIPGIGTAIGALIGGLADVAFGGDGKKRSNTGVLVGPKWATNPLYTEQASSGLLLAAHQRRGDTGAAIELRDALIGIDDLLTGISRGNGLTIDFSNVELKAPYAADAGHSGTDPFFGAVGFNGKDEVGGFETAPDEFVKAWLKEVDDQLPERVKRLMRTITEETAESLVEGFGASFDIDRMLNLDVVKRTDEALRELSQKQASLIEQYHELTDSVLEAVTQIDGTGMSLRELADVLAEQKTIAAQLASGYRAVSIEVDGLLGNTIARIRESLMSDEELYMFRREQIRNLTGELEQAVSPEEISNIVRQIDALSNSAFGLLNDAQQDLLAPETIEYLENANRIAQDRIDAGLADLSAREASLVQAVDVDLAGPGVQAFESAATSLQESTDQLSAILGNFQFGGVAGGFGNINLEEILARTYGAAETTGD